MNIRKRHTFLSQAIVTDEDTQESELVVSVEEPVMELMGKSNVLQIEVTGTEETISLTVKAKVFKNSDFFNSYVSSDEDGTKNYLITSVGSYKLDITGFEEVSISATVPMLGDIVCKAKEIALY